MEILGVRLVGLDAETVAKLLLTTVIVLARFRADGISIASATFELVKAPELALRPVGRAPPPDAREPGAPRDAR